MSSTSKHSILKHDKFKKEEQPKMLHSESVLNHKRESSKQHSIAQPVFTPKGGVQRDSNILIKDSQRVLSTPKDSNPTIFKFTGLKLKPKETNKSQYTNLIRLGLSAKEEIMKENVESKQVPLITPKKPLLINNLMKEIRSSSHLGNPIQKDQFDEMRVEMNVNSPKHPCVSKKIEPKNISPDLLKAKLERPVTSASKNPPAVFKVCHEKRNSLSLAEPIGKHYLLKAKK